jgi:hypothetical protein
MQKREKVILTVAIVFAVLTVLTLCVSIPLLLEYFRLIALQQSTPADSVSQGLSQGLGAAFSLVFFLIFALIGGGCCIPALITGIFAYRVIPSGKARYVALTIWIFCAVYLVTLGITLLCIAL